MACDGWSLLITVVVSMREESVEKTPQEENPLPKVGEIRRLTEISWDPWVMVTRVEPDADGNMVARFAVMDEMDDDVLTPIPDGLVLGLEQSVGDEQERRELAEIIDRDPEIDKRWCPPDRLAVLGGAGIQGVDYDG